MIDKAISLASSHFLFTRTLKQDCPMYITLRADDSGKALKVTSLCLDHNHEVSQVGCVLQFMCII